MVDGRAQPSLHGFLVIDKPAGWTSHDVVARVRRLLGERRIGHAGTLDPAATGVLPVAVGGATKVLEFLEGASKTYVAEITFGVETDSYDADGTVTACHEPGSLSRDEIASVVASFIGPQRQIPPMHSAVKIGGRRLYDAARRGEVVERPARGIVLHALDVLDWEPPVLSLLVDCSKGTYVRSLAFDLGRAVGTGAYLSNLVRVRSGPFTLCQAWTMAELAELIDDAGNGFASIWSEVALHPDSAIADWPALLIEEAARRLLLNGRTWEPPTGENDVPVDGTRARAYDVAGRWLGVVRWDAATRGWRPEKMAG